MKIKMTNQETNRQSNDALHYSNELKEKENQNFSTNDQRQNFFSQESC